MTRFLKTQGVNAEGRLTLCGADAVELAREFGTPLYVMDENVIRYKCRAYADALERNFGKNARAYYASKAASFREMYRIVSSEGLGADVVSGGEIFTAVSAGMPPETLCFHGNNKTAWEIRFALEKGVGLFVVDNEFELETLDRIAGELGKTQDILLRLNPGVDAHTFEAVATGLIDSQFGAAIATGQAMSLVKRAFSYKNIRLHGYHCHIGSQIFTSEPFVLTVDIMLDFVNEVRRELGFTADTLNFGGGLGVRYTERDPEVDIAACVSDFAARLKERCAELKLPLPFIMMEPGRGVVGDAGTTLYTIGGVKVIPSENDPSRILKRYVTVDGGMSDNPRYALYRSEYSAAIADRPDDEADFVCTIAGRCCESGALIQENIALQSPRPGDVLAVFTTGAYCFSMASNYNRVGRPPVIMLRDGQPRVAVRRETMEDMAERDL